MSEYEHISDGCPYCGARPMDWEHQNTKRLTTYDREKCQICGGIFDVEGVRIYPVSKGSGVVEAKGVK